MSELIDNFKTNYNSRINQRSFEAITKLTVKGNEAAYISFLNALTLNVAVKSIEHYGQKQK